jgi:hypothetical protein
MTAQARGTKEKSESARTTASGKGSGQSGRSTTSATGTSHAKASEAKASAGRTSAGRTSAGRTSQTKTSQAKTPQAKTSAARTPDRGATLPVPVVTPHLKVYKFRLPSAGMSYVADAGHVVAGYLPPPERLVFYGGLGVAAVFGVIDWPVAAAIGVGTAIARRATRGHDGGARAGRPRSGQQQRATAKS